jgi:hypothetical protein
VLLGTTLIDAEKAQFGSGAGTSITLIMSHEFSHILQFRKGFYQRVQLQELHADFMAGWLLGKMYKTYTPGENPMDMQSAGVSIWQKGSLNYRDPQFHGTPSQRYLAMTSGFGSSQAGTADVDQAFAEGVERCSSIASA